MLAPQLGRLPPPLAGEGWGGGEHAHAGALMHAPTLALPRKRGRGRCGAGIATPSGCSAHEFVGVEAVEFGERILRLEQPGLERDLLRMLERGHGHAHVPGVGGRHDRPGGGEHGCVHLVEALAQEIERGRGLIGDEGVGAGERARHAHAFLALLRAGVGTGVDEAVGEREEIGRIAHRARQHHGAAFDHGLGGEGERGGVAVDGLGLQRRQHRGGVHRRNTHVLLDVEPAAVGDQALPGMHDAADTLDADGLATSALARAASGAPRRRPRHGGVLAQHQLDQRLVDEIGDGVEPLPLRRRAQEHGAGADGEVGAAGDHRVDRADPPAAFRRKSPFLYFRPRDT